MALMWSGSLTVSRRHHSVVEDGGGDGGARVYCHVRQAGQAGLPQVLHLLVHREVDGVSRSCSHGHGLNSLAQNNNFAQWTTPSSFSSSSSSPAEAWTRPLSSKCETYFWWWNWTARWSYHRRGLAVWSSPRPRGTYRRAPRYPPGLLPPWWRADWRHPATVRTHQHLPQTSQLHWCGQTTSTLKCNRFISLTWDLLSATWQQSW